MDSMCIGGFHYIGRFIESGGKFEVVIFYSNHIILFLEFFCCISAIYFKCMVRGGLREIYRNVSSHNGGIYVGRK